MANFLIPKKPVYNDAIRKLETTDRGHADVFNAVFQELINNQAYLKKANDDYAQSMTNISHEEIDALGNMPPGSGGTGGSGVACSCGSITSEEIQAILEEMKRNGRL